MGAAYLEVERASSRVEYLVHGHRFRVVDGWMDRGMETNIRLPTDRMSRRSSLHERLCLTMVLHFSCPRTSICFDNRV